MSRARWQIQHRTAYLYVAPARDSINEVRLMPSTNAPNRRILRIDNASDRAVATVS